MNGVKLSKNNILQMNVTVIAGLLILLTLQYSSTVSLEDLVMKNRALETEIISLAILSENSTDAEFKEKINDRIDDLKLQRESVRSELTVNAKIPWELYARTNPWVVSSSFILPFLVSSGMILYTELTRKEPENYHPKWPIRISMYGFGFLIIYFLYQIIPIGRILVNPFI